MYYQSTVLFTATSQWLLLGCACGLYCSNRGSWLATRIESVVHLCRVHYIDYQKHHVGATRVCMQQYDSTISATKYALSINVPNCRQELVSDPACNPSDPLRLLSFFSVVEDSHGTHFWSGEWCAFLCRVWLPLSAIFFTFHDFHDAAALYKTHSRFNSSIATSSSTPINTNPCTWRHKHNKFIYIIRHSSTGKLLKLTD